MTAARFELVGGDVGHARRLLAAAPEERRGWEWDYLNAALDQSTLTVRGLGTPVWFLDVSPDGERVAAMRLGTGVDPVFERAVELFQTSDGTQIATLGEEKHFANGFEFSADGRSIVSSGEVMLPSVWDGLDGSLRWGARIEIDSRPPSFGFSHDSTRVAAAYAGGTIRVFAAGDGSELLVLESGAEDALQPTFSGDDRQVVALTRDGWIRSWDARTGEVRHGRRLTGYFSNLARIVGLGAAGFAVVADGKVHRLNGELDLLPLRYDGQALRAIYHEGRHALLIQTYRVLQLQPLDGIDPVVWPWISADGGSIAVDRQGSVIACSGADETSIGLFRPGDAAFRATLLGHTDRVSAMEFAGDSTDLVTASRDGTIRVWRDVLTARDAFCGGMGSGDPRLSACGRFAFGEQRDAENRDGLALWPVDGAGSSWTVVREEGRYLSHCALDATSARVAVLDESGRLEVRDAVHGGLVANAIDRAAGDSLVAFVPGRNEVLVADGGGTVYRYDVEGGALQRRYEAASDSGGNVLAAESDVVVLGRHDGGLACWDLESGALLWEAVDPDQPVDQPVGSDHFGYQASAVEQAVVGPGADVLAALHEDGRVRVLDLETGTDRYSLAMRLGLAECVAFHPTAARIAVGYADGAVRVFDQATGVERLRVDLRRGNVGASAVLSLGFTPDGSRLIAIHRGGRVETYDSLPASQRWHADRDNLAMEAPDRAWVEAAIAQSGGVDSLVGELRNGTVTHAAGVHAARVAVAVFVQSVRDRALELEIDDPNESSVLQRIATDPAWTDVERRVAARWFDDRDPESDRLAWRLLREIRVLATANRQQLRRLTDCARRIMELGTDDPTTLYHVGAIELEIFGEPAAALLALERAALASDNYEHDYGYDELERSRDAYLAMAHWRLGHPDAARAALASARGGPGGELSEEEERVLNLAAQMIEINAGND